MEPGENRLRERSEWRTSAFWRDEGKIWVPITRGLLIEAVLVYVIPVLLIVGIAVWAIWRYYPPK